MYQPNTHHALSQGMLEKLDTLIERLESPTQKTKYINTFLLTNWSYNMFKTGFLTRESCTIKNLPDNYGNELLNMCSSTSNPQPLHMIRETVIDILKDYRDFMNNYLTNLAQEVDVQKPNALQETVDEQKEFTFQTEQDVFIAFDNLEILRNYNKRQYEILQTFDEYQKDELEDVYNAIRDACKQALNDANDLELEDNLSEPDDIIDLCLPEFQNLEDALSGGLEENNPDLLKKCLCLESVACLGTEQLGPLPIFPNLTDLEIIDDVDTGDFDDGVAKVFHHHDDYFRDNEGARLRPREMMELYASRFLAAAQIPLNNEKALSKIDHSIEIICNDYNKRNNTQINSKALSTMTIAALRDFYASQMRQNEQNEIRRLNHIRNAEQAQQQQQNAKTQELVQAGNSVINELNNILERRSRGIPDNN